MAITSSPRFGLTRWSNDEDAWSRAQWDTDNGKVDDLAAIARRGPLADRGAAEAWPRSFYEDTDSGSLYWSTGTKWRGPYSADPDWTVADSNMGVGGATASNARKESRLIGRRTVQFRYSAEAYGSGDPANPSPISVQLPYYHDGVKIVSALGTCWCIASDGKVYTGLVVPPTVFTADGKFNLVEFMDSSGRWSRSWTPAGAGTPPFDRAQPAKFGFEIEYRVDPDPFVLPEV